MLNMSASIQGWAWSQKELGPPAKFVLVALAESSFTDGHSRATFAEIAKMTGYTVGGVKRALAGLLRRGLVEISGEKGCTFKIGK